MTALAGYTCVCGAFVPYNVSHTCEYRVGWIEKPPPAPPAFDNAPLIRIANALERIVVALENPA